MINYDNTNICCFMSQRNVYISYYFT